MSDWFNLGYWARQGDFSAAARELALILGRGLKIAPGHKILDVGFGDGPQLKIWLNEFNAGGVVGLERKSSPAFAWRDPRLSLHQGDAADLRKLSSPDFAPPDLALGDFDGVLALDCAYHFRTRESFLRGAHAMLKPGGRIALTDILPREEKDSFLRRCLFRVCGIPRENMYARESLARIMDAAGFENVRIQLMDRAVLRGFEKFARRYPARKAWAMPRGRRLKFYLTGLLLKRVNRLRIFHYVLVTADKK